MKVKTVKLKVSSMACTSCEDLINEEVLSITGVSKCKSNYKTGIVIVECDWNLNEKILLKKISSLGYKCNLYTHSQPNNEIFKVALIILIGFIILKLSSNSGGFNIGDALSSKVTFGALFIIGVFSSLHCVGMCGGIMLSQSITIDEGSLNKKLIPALKYNAGRLLSYTALGGVVGGIGSVFSLSSNMQAFISILSGLFMVIMGFNFLGFNTFKRFSIKLPFMSCKKSKSSSPFIVGILNGIMPCGPLQTMQLYALSTGSVLTGALSMFFFALGTIPLMLIFGLFANLLSGNGSKSLIKYSGILIIILGISMGGRGISLLGVSLPSSSGVIESVPVGSKAIIDGNTQTVSINASTNGYTPKRVYVEKGVPLNFIINGERITSCNNEIVIKSENIKKKLSKGENKISFTPTENIKYSCWMGMLRGEIVVVDDLSSLKEDNNSQSTNEDDFEIPEADFYGIPLSKVPSERLIKFTEVKEGKQSLEVTQSDGNLEPSVIVVKSNTPLTLNFNLTNIFNGSYEMFNSDFSEILLTLEIKDGLGTLKHNSLGRGAYGLMKNGELYCIIQVVDDFSEVNIEELRDLYF
ncbi:MAG: sulfite exporter TauE/SafE family protein [Clostridium sp.]